MDAQDQQRGHSFPAIMWSQKCALLLNYYCSGQPEPRQNNGRTIPHKGAVSSLTLCHKSRASRVEKELALLGLGHSVWGQA